MTYTLSLTNTATEPVTLTALSDTLLGGLHGQGDCALPQALAVGAAYSCSYSTTVTGNAGETLPNTLTATAQDDEGNPTVENTLAVVAFTDALPSLAASFSVQPPSLPEPGGTVTYTLVLTNTATEPLTLTALSDTLLGGLHGQGDCNLPQTLTVGAAYSCTYPVAVSGNAGETLPNTLTAAAQDDEGNTVVENASTSVTFTDALPTLAASFSVQPPSLPEPGGTVTYTLSLTNTSTEPLTLTALSDTLLGGLHGQGDCALPQTLAVGAAYSCTYPVAVSGNAGETLPNTLTAAAQDDEGNPAVENALATVTFTDALPAIDSELLRGPRLAARARRDGDLHPGPHQHGDRTPHPHRPQRHPARRPARPGRLRPAPEPDGWRGLFLHLPRRSLRQRRRDPAQHPHRCRPGR